MLSSSGQRTGAIRQSRRSPAIPCNRQSFPQAFRVPVDSMDAACPEVVAARPPVRVAAAGRPVKLARRSGNVRLPTALPGLVPLCAAVRFRADFSQTARRLLTACVWHSVRFDGNRSSQLVGQKSAGACDKSPGGRRPLCAEISPHSPCTAHFEFRSTSHAAAGPDCAGALRLFPEAVSLSSGV